MTAIEGGEYVSYTLTKHGGEALQRLAALLNLSSDDPDGQAAALTWQEDGRG